MQKQDYAGLSRTFDMYYPDVKELVEETEQFYNSTYTDSERWRLTDYDNVRLIGTFTINKNDNDVTLPRLYFKKEAEMANPAFYIITRPAPQDKERIIHIGTSVEAAVPYACSVSALTGGILPHIEKNRAFSVYLKIMSYVKKYGYCTVYELQTGYDDICIKGINGTTYAKEAFSKQIFSFINCDNTGKKFNDDFFLSPEEKVEKDMQNYRNNNIWDAVTAFKTMANTKPEVLEALKELKENEEKPKEEDCQEITVTQLEDGIKFTFKNHIDLVTWDECEAVKVDELDSSIPLGAKILCQPGDTPYEQYTSFISKKYKDVGQQFNITENPTINSISKMNFYKKQSALQLFEDTIIEHGGPDVWVEYQNIGMQKIEHHIGRLSRLTSGDRTSAIVITKMGDLSFHNIGVLLSLIMSAFCLNPMKTKIGFKF